MADLHKINDAINKRVGRNLVTSTIVGVLLLVVVFGSAYFVQGVFGVLAWFAAMVATRELKLAYRHGGIEVPEHGLQIAATAMILAAWFGKVSALAVVTSFVILHFYYLTFLIILTFFSNGFTSVGSSSISILFSYFLIFILNLLRREYIAIKPRELHQNM